MYFFHIDENLRSKFQLNYLNCLKKARKQKTVKKNYWTSRLFFFAVTRGVWFGRPSFSVFGFPVSLFLPAFLFKYINDTLKPWHAVWCFIFSSCYKVYLIWLSTICLDKSIQKLLLLQKNTIGGFSIFNAWNLAVNFCYLWRTWYVFRYGLTVLIRISWFWLSRINQFDLTWWWAIFGLFWLSRPEESNWCC